MTRLIDIRRNSGSGKTTAAHTLRRVMLARWIATQPRRKAFLFPIVLQRDI